MRTVMIVDDEEIVVRAIKRRVSWKKLGIDRILEANSMKQAIALFEQEEVDILLCDIEMPEGTGLELFEWVKGYFPYVECIYVTCHPDFEYMRNALKLGSFDYILKPIDYEELEHVLTEAIHRSDENSHLKNHIHKKALKKLGGSKDAVGSTTDIIGKIKQYVKDHLQEEISMEDIAEVVYLNPQYMARMFKKHEGISILEYITDRRIEMASVLLRESDYTIYQVAGMVGYANYSYFTRVYKKMTGKTPQDYKKAYGKNRLQ